MARRIGESGHRFGQPLVCHVVVPVIVAFVVLLETQSAAAGGMPGAMGAMGGMIPGMGGGGFNNTQALTGLQNAIQGNISTVASIAVLAIGLFLLWSKSAWMELLGGLSFIATLGILVVWAAGSTGSFFGQGGLL
jgi:hypothetical protein